MFFWLTFGLFVGFTTVNVIAHRKKKALLGPINKDKLLHNNNGLNGLNGFMLGDRVLFQNDDFEISKIIEASDGARKIAIALFETCPNQALVQFNERHELRLFSLAEAGRTASTVERLEKDGVVFVFELETRMRRTDGDGTLLLTAYESENHAKFLWYLETSGKMVTFQGDAVVDDEINILPNR